jgi:hypothetical protein
MVGGLSYAEPTTGMPREPGIDQSTRLGDPRVILVDRQNSVRNERSHIYNSCNQILIELFYFSASCWNTSTYRFLAPFLLAALAGRLLGGLLSRSSMLAEAGGFAIPGGPPGGRPIPPGPGGGAACGMLSAAAAGGAWPAVTLSARPERDGGAVRRGPVGSKAAAGVVEPETDRGMVWNEGGPLAVESGREGSEMGGRADRPGDTV